MNTRYDGLLTGNRHADGHPGRRIVVDDDYDAYGLYGPCYDDSVANSDVAINWSSTGPSWGVVRNARFDDTRDWIFASTVADHGSDSCTAPAGSEQCIGVASYDISAQSVGHSWHPSVFYDTDTHTADIVDLLAIQSATADAIIVGHRDQQRIDQHQKAGSSVNYYADATNVTRLEWLDDRYYVATIGGGAGGSPDELWIGDRLDADTDPFDIVDSTLAVSLVRKGST